MSFQTGYLPPMRTCVITPVCNQGPFLLEWVAWYKGLGFTDILAVSNNCTDGSDIILDILAEDELVTHLALGDLDTGTPPLRQVFAAAKTHPLLDDMDWVMICDVDEFLVLHRARSIKGFLSRVDANFLGLAIHWKCFGAAPQDTYKDGLVHRQFRGAAPEKSQANRFFKSIFRNPGDFTTLNSHSPNGYKKDWDEEGAYWVTADYQKLGNFYAPDGHSQKSTTPEAVSHKRAQLNHYVTRSREHMAAKMGTPSASNLSDRYTDEFYEVHNRSSELDFTADKHLKRFRAVHDEMKKNPDLMRAHHAACAFYVQWLCERTGRDFESDDRFVEHRDLAMPPN